jgi:hypothetical protein
MDKREIINKLVNLGFTDSTDVNKCIGLYEYGFLRNPKTSDTIIASSTVCAFDEDVTGISFDILPITLEDIKEQLQDISATEKNSNFWIFIGVEKNKYIDSLTNDYLTNAIIALNDYFSNYRYDMNFNLTLEQVLKNVSK